MAQYFRTLSFPAMLSLFLLLPFLLLEVANRRQYHEPFPYSLFAVLWLLQLVFLLLLKPVLQGIRLGKTGGLPRLLLFLCAVCLALIAWAWVSLLADQMPCFLGVPNCD